MDLYRVVRQSVMIGEPSYSLKYVEHLTGAGARATWLPPASRWSFTSDGSPPRRQYPRESAILKQIRDYNEQDCQSTAELAELALESAVHGPPTPPPPPTKTTNGNRVARVETEPRRALARRSSRNSRRSAAGNAGERLRVTELLAHLLEFHRREEKPIWWRRFDRMEMEEQELIDDPECLGGLARTARPAEKVQDPSRTNTRSTRARRRSCANGDKFLFAHDWKRAAPSSSSIWMADERS